MTDPGEFNERALEMLRRVGNGKLLASMAQLFCASAPERMEQIQDAASAGDAAGAVMPAHTLKSSAGQIGAARLQHVCGEIEKAAEENDLSRVRSLVADAEPILARALAWVENNAVERETS